MTRCRSRAGGVIGGDRGGDGDQVRGDGEVAVDTRWAAGGRVTTAQAPPSASKPSASTAVPLTVRRVSWVEPPRPRWRPFSTRPDPCPPAGSDARTTELNTHVMPDAGPAARSDPSRSTSARLQPTTARSTTLRPVQHRYARVGIDGRCLSCDEPVAHHRAPRTRETPRCHTRGLRSRHLNTSGTVTEI